MNRNGLRAAVAAAALVGGLATAGTATAEAVAPQCAAAPHARISSQQLGAHLAQAIALESTHRVAPDTGPIAGAAV